MRRRLSLVVAVAFAGTLVSGCDAPRPAAAPPAPVTIALAASPGDTDVVTGARFAVEMVNGTFPDLPLPLAARPGLPGLGGAVLDLAVVDTRGAAVAKVSETLRAKRVVAVVSAGSAGTTTQVSAQTERLRLPLLDAVTSADSHTDLGQEWYFRTSPTDRMYADAAFALLRYQQLAETPEIKLAVLHDGGAEALLALVRQLAGTAGYPTMIEIDTRTGTADAQAVQLRDAQANVLVAVSGAKDGATAATRLAGRLVEPLPVLGIGPGFAALPDGDGSPPLIRSVGWSAEYAARNPLAAAVSKAYQKRFGRPMTATAAQVFTATLALAVALNSAGDANPTAVRATLRQMWLPATQVMLPWSGIRFDAAGQNTLAGAVMEARTDAGFRVVYPRELATVPVPW